MIMPDVNVLVYAFRVDTPQHVKCSAWLQELEASGVGLSLCDNVISGFLRVVTHPRVISPPTPIEHALRFVRWLTESPTSRWLGPSDAVWDIFARIATNDQGVRGNIVPDAYLAALCLAHGVTIASSDRGFARFEGLRIVNPVIG